MNDKIVEFISNIDSFDYDDFYNNSSIDSTLDLKHNLLDYDISWLDELEEYLPFVNNIIYLDYTNTNNSIVLKSYENRFIKTLLQRLYNFLLSERKKINNMDSENLKELKSNLNTFINNDDVEINIDIKIKNNSDVKNRESYGLNISERIDRVLNIVVSLLESDFIKSLSDLEVIKGDINKTEVFEQELNYKKAYELYLSLEKYIKSREELDINDMKNKIEDEFIITSYLEYKLLSNCYKNSKNNTYKDFLDRLIEKLVTESSIDEKSFKKMITKKFEDEYTKKKNREKNIQNIFLKAQDNYNKQIKDALRVLKS